MHCASTAIRYFTRKASMLVLSFPLFAGRPWAFAAMPMAVTMPKRRWEPKLCQLVGLVAPTCHLTLNSRQQLPKLSYGRLDGMVVK